VALFGFSGGSKARMILGRGQQRKVLPLNESALPRKWGTNQHGGCNEQT
jgi:hypothetical protein